MAPVGASMCVIRCLVERKNRFANFARPWNQPYPTVRVYCTACFGYGRINHFYYGILQRTTFNAGQSFGKLNARNRNALCGLCASTNSPFYSPYPSSGQRCWMDARSINQFNSSSQFSTEVSTVPIYRWYDRHLIFFLFCPTLGLFTYAY